MSKNKSAGERRAEKKRACNKSKKLKKIQAAPLYPKNSQSLGVEPKLSETILEFGKPLLEEAESIEQEKYAIELSIYFFGIYRCYHHQKKMV